MKQIKINYEISGIIKTKLKNKNSEIHISATTSLKDFLSKNCGIPSKYFKYLDITINGKHKDNNYILKNNDKIIILMPIGGG